jgi:DNA (cytosine-5)-methyltransferase 1
MWPEAIRAVCEIRPRAFLFENVQGLLRPAFAEYLAHIVFELERGGESGEGAPQLYDVAVVRVDAANYGAAQRRKRVLIAGVRKDVGALTPFPQPTHSAARLAYDKWVSGAYWTRHGLLAPDIAMAPAAERAVLNKIGACLQPVEQPWRTCRDAFLGLGRPQTPASVLGHNAASGEAKQYPGHTGSPEDLPSKALKAGVNGVPGGENMLVSDTGTCRYFTVREAARLQGLSDTFLPYGSYSEGMRQLGNAIPAQLAEVAGRWLFDILTSKNAGA